MIRRFFVAVVALLILTSLDVRGAELRKFSVRHGGEYLVTLRRAPNETVASGAQRLATQHGIIVERVWENLDTFLIKNVPETIAQMLARSPWVESIQENAVLHSQGCGATLPADDSQWALDDLDGSRNHHNFTCGPQGQGVLIYILDSGVERTHPEFVSFYTGGSRVIYSYNAVNPGTPEPLCLSHGTSVASVAAGSTLGVASDAAIASVTVLDCNDSASDNSLAEGVNWVIQQQHDNPNQRAVANISIYNSQIDPLFESAVSRLVSANIMVASCAGNDNVNACTSSRSSADRWTPASWRTRLLWLEGELLELWNVRPGVGGRRRYLPHLRSKMGKGCREVRCVFVQRGNLVRRAAGSWRSSEYPILPAIHCFGACR